MDNYIKIPRSDIILIQKFLLSIWDPIEESDLSDKAKDLFERICACVDDEDN